MSARHKTILSVSPDLEPSKTRHDALSREGLEVVSRSLEVLGKNGGDDGTRTRGLCRDRELRVRNYLKAKSTDGSLNPLKDL